MNQAFPLNSEYNLNGESIEANPVVQISTPEKILYALADVDDQYV